MKQQSPKVLVCAPTYKGKDYIFWDYFKCVQDLSYDNYDHFFVDNTEDDCEYWNKLTQAGVTSTHINPKDRNHFEVMGDSHNTCRKHAIDNGYDFMLHWEVDIIPPSKYLIQDLMRHRQPVVGATYHIKTGLASHLCIQGLYGDDDYQHMANMTNGSDIMFVDGTLKQVGACGLGAVLIHNSVFNRVPFRWSDNEFEDGEYYHPDTFFHLDLHRAGIPVHVDTSIICRHFNQKWDTIKL